eukprot:gnl/TRDRNA2_/TRDRNA2_84942_c1_seq1.p1 gnl/TRDRNA2_/TRDRNA2_84942_c1~~gnl/TRDRNA2_/TRDRNA2_84942_c1_seq1.p1  ORF type:complete len:115 (+),score=27.74 gnl/TRDRNA2_/TRDRNA2_84942_c1_seq1:58-402(+)
MNMKQIDDELEEEEAAKAKALKREACWAVGPGGSLRGVGPGVLQVDYKIKSMQQSMATPRQYWGPALLGNHTPSSNDSVHSSEPRIVFAPPAQTPSFCPTNLQQHVPGNDRSIS